MKCPVCRKDVDFSSRYAPFCSDRCRIIDLGNWAAGAYRIPSARPEPEDTADEQERDPGPSKPEQG